MWQWWQQWVCWARLRKWMVLISFEFKHKHRAVLSVSWIPASTWKRVDKCKWHVMIGNRMSSYNRITYRWTQWIWFVKKSKNSNNNSSSRQKTNIVHAPRSVYMMTLKKKYGTEINIKWALDWLSLHSSHRMSERLRFPKKNPQILRLSMLYHCTAK